MEGDDDAIRAAVDAGKAQLWRAHGPQADGYAVTRIEKTGHGLEMVVVAGAGRGFRQTMAMLERIADDSGVPSMRAHVRRRGLKHLFEQRGWTLDQFIMRRG